MPLNHHPIKCCHSCGSVIATTSDDVDGPIASRRVTTKEMIEMLIQIFGQLSGPSLELNSSDGSFNSIHLLRKVFDVMLTRNLQTLIAAPQVQDLICRVVGGHVRESVRPVMDKLVSIEEEHRGSEAETASASVRTLQFVFLDEVSGPVLTGKEIKSGGDKPIRVALTDTKTGKTVNSGSESSLRAEIVLLDATDDNDENKWTCEDFLKRIVKEGDKKKPHFSKTQYVDLKEGVGSLLDVKLGQDKSWTKNSRCKLGVRIAGNVRVVEVREAWTETFTVCDSRGKLYEKGNPPCLSDPLWKLECIGRDGGPIKRLEENNIKTVKDFLFLHSIDPTRLQKIIFGEKRKAKEAKWDAIVKHAKTCLVDRADVYVHFPMSESQTGVAFDAVGRLKGLVVDKSRYVPLEDLSEDDKDVARGLMLSAFENRNDTTSFPDEASLLERYPPHPPSPVVDACECDPPSASLDFSMEQIADMLHDSPGSMRLYDAMYTNQIPSHSYNPDCCWYPPLWDFHEEEENEASSPPPDDESRGQLIFDVVRLRLLAHRTVAKFKELGSRKGHHAQKRRRLH